MSRIFLSYRREDAGGHAGRLFDRLAERFGRDQVFMDVDDLEAGADFPQALREALDRCQVLVVVIGPRWAEIQDRGGQQRLTRPDDFVRLEVTTALDRGIPILPVLVAGATMPGGAVLPEEIVPLTRRQAVSIDDRRFGDGAGEVVRAVERLVGPDLEESAGKQRTESGVNHPTRQWWILGAAAILLAVGTWLVVGSGSHDGARPHLQGATTPAVTGLGTAEGDSSRGQTSSSGGQTLTQPASPVGARPSSEGESMTALGAEGQARPVTRASGARPQPASRAAGDRPSIGVDLSGLWRAEVRYGDAWGGRSFREWYRFELQGQTLSGSASMLGVGREIQKGRVDGNRLTFETRWQLDPPDLNLFQHNRYTGTVEKDRIRFVYEEVSSPRRIEFDAIRSPEP